MQEQKSAILFFLIEDIFFEMKISNKERLKYPWQQ
jgi:hypothetical protein